MTMNAITDMVHHLTFTARLLGGIVLIFIGGVWMAFAAYSEDTTLGRLLTFVPGLALFFCAEHPKKGLPPLILQLIGMALFASAVFSRFPGGNQ